MAEPLLADTHVLLWYFEGLKELAPRQVRRLDAALAGASLCASVVSLYEIGLLMRKGRLRRLTDLSLWLRRAIALGLVVLPLDAECALEATRLPGEPPGDPFDQLLVATSRVHGLLLATRDGSVQAYSAAGHVRTVDV